MLVIHRSTVNSSYNDQWRGALMFSLICAWTNRWVNNGHAGDLRHHRFHYDVIVMIIGIAVYQVSGGDNLWKDISGCHFGKRKYGITTNWNLNETDVGVTKSPLNNFFVKQIFDPAKVPVKFFTSHSYLTGVTTAELWRHLPNMPNMNVVLNSSHVFWQCWQIRKITESPFRYFPNLFGVL